MALCYSCNSGPSLNTKTVSRKKAIYLCAGMHKVKKDGSFYTIDYANIFRTNVMEKKIKIKKKTQKGSKCIAVLLL
jgi:hypothetical protein